MLSNETRRVYKTDFNCFLAFLNIPKDASDAAILAALVPMNRQQAAAYRDYLLLDRNLSASTVCRRLSIANTVFEMLKEENLIERNPFSRVKRPKVGNTGTTPAFNRRQAELILAQPNLATEAGRRDRIILLLLFYCGLRRSEVCKVAAEDFYEDQGHILLRVHGKGRSDKDQRVKIPARIWPEIKMYLAGREGLLFTGVGRNGNYNRKDRPIGAGRIYLMFRRYCRMAGLPPEKYSPHSTRATFITLCLAGGADVRSVMYAARHSDPSTTIRYDRARQDLEKHATDYLDLGRP